MRVEVERMIQFFDCLFDSILIHENAAGLHGSPDVGGIQLQNAPVILQGRPPGTTRRVVVGQVEIGGFMLWIGEDGALQ